MNKDRIFWGSCFLLIAVLMVTNQIWGTFEIGLFKGIVTIFCAAFIIRSIPAVSFFGILLPVALILTMYRNDFGLEIDNYVIWSSAVLSSIGLELIFKDAKKKLNNKRQINKSKALFESSNVTGEHIKLKNAFGHTTKYINSDSFLTGKFENSFGSFSVYLNNAIIQNGEAKIRVENSFGEMNIYIPKDWKAENKIHSFAGTAVNNNCNFDAQYPIVRFEGDNAFGCVNIYHL